MEKDIKTWAKEIHEMKIQELKELIYIEKVFTRSIYSGRLKRYQKSLEILLNHKN